MICRECHAAAKQKRLRPRRLCLAVYLINGDPIFLLPRQRAHGEILTVDMSSYYKKLLMGRAN
jgi:hypothetical protein